MGRRYSELLPVVEREKALTQMLREELPADIPFDATGLTVALQICIEFDQIWPHKLPDQWDLVLADRAGRLDELVAEIETKWLTRDLAV